MMDADHFFCDYCGRANRREARFCRMCGQPLPDDLPSSSISNTFAVRTPTGHLRLYQLLKQRYRILQLLGKGGMGHVYKAADIHLGDRPVAVKEMSQQGLNTQEIVEAADAFKQEALLLAKLIHPNLPRVYDHFDEMGHWYLVMDFIEGETLTQHLEKAPGGRLSLQEALRIGLILCDVLSYLHIWNPPIIFRDLKPDNIMLRPDGHLYLIDFGIARHFKTGKAKDTGIAYSIGYAAPEQYGKHQTDPRSDIYSLGATLHHLLSGNHPAESMFRFAPLHLKDHAAKLEVLIMQMVDLDEHKRPTDVVTVKEKLERIRDQHSREPNPSPQPSPYNTVPEPAPSTPSVPSQPPPKTPTFPPSSSSQPGARPPSPSPSVPNQLNAHLPVASQGTPQPSGSLVRASSQGASGLSISQQQTVGPPTAPSPPLSIQERQLSHADVVWSVAWSPDGRRLASGGADKMMRVWDTSTGEQLWQRAASHVVRAVAWAGDGTQLASGGWDRTVQGWDATTGRLVFAYSGHADMVRAVVWSPDGTQLASAGKDQTVRVWDAARRNILYTYTKHRGTVNALAWSPDSKQLASASHDKTVQVWDASTGQPFFHYTHEDVVEGLAWAPNGKYLASCGQDTTVQVYDLATKTAVWTSRLHERWVYAVAWSPDSRYLASAGRDKKVHVWEALTGIGSKVYTCQAEVLAVAWSPNGKYLAYSDGKDVLVKKVE